MKLFIGFSALILMMNITTVKLDFGKQKFGRDWFVINDGVMGGLSQGTIALTDNSMVFKGKVSLENNGGFSSFRSPYQNMDFSGFKNITMRVRTNGQKFGFVMSTHSRFYVPNYKKTFKTQPGKWQTFTFQLRDFDQYRVGQRTGRKIPEEFLSKIIRIGFITDFKAENAFELEVDYIEFN